MSTKAEHIEYYSSDNLNLQLMFHPFALFAKIERSLILEISVAGREITNAQGHFCGRPKN
ncbi:hypothetical protein JZO80_04620 [Vagococcus fluvialis]|uniref:hypothetical protein n=1 Tax=Vagococcus fluvialis TaxID=2738 RepID=UPI0011776F4B|nr:hypothetical protein [Vagococcus fluvialis]MBO0419438.1 hypothetical protein [Vagococcus fluvialis]